MTGPKGNNEFCFSETLNISEFLANSEDGWKTDVLLNLTAS